VFDRFNQFNQDLPIMFNAATSKGRAGRTAALYQQVGIETQISTASPHALTMILFDRLIGAVRQARLAIDAGQVEDKGRHIGMAVRIIDEGLRSSLNMQDGGEIALNLRDLYDYAQIRLLKANLHHDGAALDEVIDLITPVRDAWSAIGDSVPA
jgi:flagellar protein FliS